MMFPLQSSRRESTAARPAVSSASDGGNVQQGQAGNVRRTDHRNVRWESRNNMRDRHDTRECTDWLQETLVNYSVKEIADKAGCSLRAAENAKRGENGMSMANLITFMRNDPYFRARLHVYGGGDTAQDADPLMLAQALTRTITDYLQGQK